MIIQDK